MLRSYDIDGVLSVGIKPTPPCIIVSGRLASLMPETRKQFAQLGIDPDIPVYLRPTGEAADRVAAGHWKAAIINAAKVDEHWEDDPVQIRIIQQLCKVAIVMVQRAEVAHG